jgi:hypothetical protein
MRRRGKMKNKVQAILIGVVAALVVAGGISPLWGQEKAKKESPPKEEPGLSISRAVMATGVENREPVGAAAVFPATTEKVYCFLEAANIPKDMDISLIWSHGQKEMSKISLPLKAGSRWRTFAHKNLGGLKGDWKVEIKDAEGKLLKDLSFKTE